MTAIAAVLFMQAPASGLAQQTAFSHGALDLRAPAVREHWYTMNAKVRPLLLFWIGRNDVGGARLTWRESTDGRRAYELLAGSDPTRAPRKINRWGFIVEEWSDGKAEVFGVMKESDEETLEEAEEEIAREDGQAGVFKAIRMTIANGRAVSGTMTSHAPSELTYRELDELLALVPAEASKVRTLDVPEGTQMGFLSAMDLLMRNSVEACRAKGAGARGVPPVVYFHSSRLYDLSLTSCDFEPTVETKRGVFTEVIDARFQIVNRESKGKTNMRVFFGASGELRAVPIRAVFRPRWWMEVELVLDRSAKGLPAEAS